MKIYMERTLDAIVKNDPKLLPEMQEKVAKLEPKKLNGEHYFINRETETV